MALPEETSTVQEGVGSSQGCVSEPDHGANPRQPLTQDAATRVIGVNQASTLAPSQEEAGEEMAQVFIDTHASSTDLEEQYAEDDNGQKENGDENLYGKDNDSEGFRGLEI